MAGRQGRAVPYQQFGGMPAGHDGSDNEDDERGYRSRFANFGSSRVDFTKLEMVSLQRYHKAYKLPDYPTANRDDLMGLIAQHFAILCVDEDETLIRFAMACRRNGQRLGLGVKKPRAGSVRPRGR